MSDADPVLDAARAAFDEADGARRGWSLGVTLPLPHAWPPTTLAHYVYGRRTRSGIADGEELAAPVARVDLAGSPPRATVTRLTPSWAVLGIDGVRPLTDGELALLDACRRAPPLPSLLAAAPHDAAAALLVRRRYGLWRATTRIADVALREHPAFTAFLDRVAVVVAEAPREPPSPEPLTVPEFDRRWPRSPTREWMRRVSPAFPTEWPARSTTAFCHYAYALRVDRAHPAPCPRETTEPYGVVVREGHTGPMRFVALAERPSSLGVVAGLAPLPGGSERARAMGRDPIDTLIRARAEPAAAAAVRAYYLAWIRDEPALAPWVLARHPAFAASLR